MTENFLPNFKSLSSLGLNSQSCFLNTHCSYWNFVIWRNIYDFFYVCLFSFNFQIQKTETEQNKKIKNRQTERVNQFILQPKRCTQFSASKFSSTLQIANRWRCYHHNVLSCAPSSAKSAKLSLCAYWVNRSLQTFIHSLLLLTNF